MKQSPSPLAIKSFAKLNLFLQVLDKRKDNFHNLSTLFCRIALADTIIFKNRKDGLIKIKCDSRYLPRGKTNLCYRAAQLLKQELGLSFGLEIEIKKRIPVGAGLGGGSSNAASVLLGLNKRWKLNLSKEKLVKLGAKLGSDIPFFIHNTKFALGSGRGDIIRPLASLKKLRVWFVLIYPKIKASTPLIYQRFDTFGGVQTPPFRAGKEYAALSINPEQTPGFSPGCVERIDSFSGLTGPRYNVKLLISKLLKNGHKAGPEYFFNSLEAVTARFYPVVDEVKGALRGMGLEKIMMSGSGPAVFAICDCQKQALDLRNKLAKKHNAWQVLAASTI